MAYERATSRTNSPYNPQHLLASSHGATTRKLTIASGQNLPAGALLGPILSPESATITPQPPISGSNGTVGSGSIGDIWSKPGALAGLWKIVITAEAANAGAFIVNRPDGRIDGVGTIGAEYDGGLIFTLADGSDDWKEDDVVPILVEYDPEQFEYRLSAATSSDGSQHPAYVLAYDVNATGSAREGIAYESATVVGSALALGEGHTIAKIREGLRAKGILIID